MPSISLNGTWAVSQSGTGDPIRAMVPGTIHTDLLAAGVIEDPFYRDNEDRLQWIGEETWLYRRSFTVPEELLTHDRVLLRCYGLDTLATITLNGVLIARTDNMFRTWEFDVKKHLRAGENALEVRFDPPTPHMQACQTARTLPSWGAPREPKGRCWVRKEPANFGWDWGPVLVTCGIWRPIELVAFNTARLTSLHIQQDHTTPDVVMLQATASVQHLQEQALTGEFTVLFGDKVVARASGELDGDRIRADISVEHPQLWWPNGMGKQPLYHVRCELYDPQHGLLDTTTKRIGLRTLRLERFQDAWGESFQFSANGVPFFAKGANWIPADTFNTRVTCEQYADLLQSAAAAHMNMIRAWGGGIYEDDAFYDLCDELGLCVWQDFIFACSTYPTFDEVFTQNVMGEVIDNITRLRHHPCLALWCGNNELEQGLVGKEWSNSHMSWEDYLKLFDSLLPSLVNLLDPERPYWPGSPHSPYGDREDFNNPRWGDAHLWSVWHGREPFEWYRTCDHRFISEFGFQSFPEPRTVYGYTRPDERNVTSYIMEHHQRSHIGNSTIMTYLLEWFRLPTDFDMTLWLSQILHGMAMTYAVEHWRRQMPCTMGTLYWQLNDCWPVASWASIDYHGRWKALHYLAKRFYAPLLVSGVEDPERGEVAIHVTSDELSAQDGAVVWQLTDAAGRVLAGASQEVAIAERANTPVTTLALQEYLAQHGARNLLLWLELWVDDACVSTNLVTFSRPKHLELVDPGLQTSVRGEGHQYTVTISAEHPALWTWLSLDGLDARYADNFVHVRPGKPVDIEVTLASPASPDEMANALRAYSLYDTYRVTQAPVFSR